jgi:hypothetical protein
MRQSEQPGAELTSGGVRRLSALQIKVDNSQNSADVAHFGPG